MWLIPGFVDVQVNGFHGVDFSDPAINDESFSKACRQLFAEGTVAFLPTMISSPVEVYERNLGLISRVMEKEEFQNRLLGIHLEGPFISKQPGAVGAHPVQCIRRPDIALFNKMQTWANGKIKLMTIAADEDGAEDLARYAVKSGVTVALGHQMALDKELDRLANAGAKALTHLGNGLPNLLPRHPNPLFSGIAHDKLYATIISDGHHLPVSVLKTIIRAKGVSKVIVTSDASPFAGMPPGNYETADNKCVLEANGKLHNPDKGCLVGSSATMIDCMNHLASLDFLIPEEMIDIGFYNPLRLIGVDPERIKSRSCVIFDADKKAFSVRPR